MDSFNINVEPQTHNITITKGEPINITVTEEKVVLNKVIEVNDISYEGKVIKIDANYPQAIEAARIATEKAEEAKEVVEGFDAHAAEKITEYDANASDKIAAYNANAVDKTNIFNSNATSKTTAFNDNATSKTSDFNTNASNKTTDFNENYTEKKAVIDSQVELAKDWATKTDGTVDGEDYSAKYYAQSILPIASDITTVAGIASDVTTVSSISSDVTSVAGNATDISTVADSISDVNSVATDILKVTAVADDLTNIDAVNANKTNIDAVAGNNSNITAVANNATNINAVAGNESNINAVNANKTNIDTVAGISTDISTVASDIANINAVAGDLTNINNASTYADNANIWAEGSDAQVQALGGVHSSKGWAEQSAQGQIQSNWAETDTTAKSYIQNKPTLGTMAAESASDYTKTSGLATVATSGSYADLSNKPTIPTVTDTYSATSSDGMSGKAVASAISGKANTNLSNLTSEGQNIANWSSNVTNCITEIPQDIKLELNNGTLTLKAGSKVYVPNGVGVFDVVTISSDLTASTSGTASKLLFYNRTTNALDHWNTGDCKSGTSWSGVEGVFYNTSTNTIKYTVNSGSTWNAEYSLPIGIATTDGGFTSIDQVFNGFGYIGSTVFALPNVKGLIPNGRNEDGSLKNVEITLTKVLTNTADYNRESDGYTTLILGQNTLDYTRDYAVSNTRPSNPRSWSSYYSEKDNLIYRYNGSSWNQIYNVVVGDIHRNTSSPWAVTSLTTKTAFHALDYNDSSTISGWAMPSGRYIDLTLGASGATYTAPANGYICLGLRAGSGNMWDQIVGTAARTGATCHSGVMAECFLPVKNGEVVTINYGGVVNVGGADQYLKFVYAIGSESEA